MPFFCSCFHYRMLSECNLSVSGYRSFSIFSYCSYRRCMKFHFLISIFSSIFFYVRSIFFNFFCGIISAQNIRFKHSVPRKIYQKFFTSVKRRQIVIDKIRQHFCSTFRNRFFFLFLCFLRNRFFPSRSPYQPSPLSHVS